MSTFGDYIKELRGKRSIREVAKDIGVSHTYLSTLEKGFDPRTNKPRKPTLDVINKLAAYYTNSNGDLTKVTRELLSKAGYATDWFFPEEIGDFFEKDENGEPINPLHKAYIDHALKKSTPIFLNEDNEGEFYFFKAEKTGDTSKRLVRIDEEKQQKIKEMIKLLLQ